MVPFASLPDRARIEAEIKALFAARVAQGLTPGACFALFDRGGIVLDGGFGARAAGGAAPDRQTRFRIASCTKSFTVAALLLLRDAGRLVLDEPITRFVPALSVPEAPSVRMLMAMAGGLPTDDPWADRQESLSNEAFHAVLRQGVRFSTVPGSRFEYSNLGYALLGQVIERVSGQPCVAFVTEQLLRPLGLAATGYDIAAVPGAQMAVGARRVDDRWLELPQTGPGAFSSIGGVISNAADLARWAAWLCAAFDRAQPQPGPLAAASRREMQAIHCPYPPEAADGYRMKGYGFGLNVEHDARLGLIVHHSGGYPGFSSHMRWHPESGIGVVAFENATYSGAWEPAAAALERVLDARPAPPAAAPPADVAALARRVAALAAQWDDAAAEAICHANVALDRSWPERAGELARLRAATGALDPARLEIRPADGPRYGRFEVRVPGAAGTLVAAVSLGPPEPARIQTLTFTVAGS